MARYIIGCSNVSRNCNPESDLHAEYTVIKAVNYSTLEKELSVFQDNGSPIIIAVIENIIEEAIQTATSQGEAREQGRQAIKNYIKLIKKYEKSTLNLW